MSRSGQPLHAPEDIPTRKRASAPLFAFPNGDVGWINDVTDDPNQLEIIRIGLRGAIPTPEPSPTVQEVTINPELNLPLLIALFDGKEAQAVALLERGADPNSQYGGWTALMYAAHGNLIGAVRVLLRRGARVNEGIDGENALTLARAAGHTEIVALLQPRVQATMRSLPRGRARQIKPRPGPIVRKRVVHRPALTFPQSSPKRFR